MGGRRIVTGCLLAIVTWTVGCTPSHFRTVDPEGARWRAEVAAYPRMVMNRGEPFPPVPAEGVKVHYRSSAGGDRWRFSPRGEEEAPPGKVLVVAYLETFRGPLPDHEGALTEMMVMAGEVGADMLTETHCTAVVAESYLGGTELVGWIYKARAARVKELAP